MEIQSQNVTKEQTSTEQFLKTAAKKYRDPGFDNMKGLLIYLVVVAHFINVPDYPSTVSRMVYIFIYFFHMPAFIFISGYFTKNVEKARETAVKEYLLPYFLLVTFSWMDIYIIQKSYCSSFRLFTAPTGCWFLFVLFVYRILAKDLVKVRNILPITLLLGIMSGFSEEFSRKLALGRIFCFLFFFLTGYFMNQVQIEKIRKIPKIITSACVLGVLYLSYYIAKNDIFPTKLLQCRTNYRDDSQIFDCKVRLLFYVVACLMIVCLVNLCAKRKCFLTKIGKNSLSVYILHLFVIRRLDLLFLGGEKLLQDPIIYFAFILGFAALVTFLFSRQWLSELVQTLIRLWQKVVFRSEITKENKEVDRNLKKKKKIDQTEYSNLPYRA